MPIWLLTFGVRALGAGKTLLGGAIGWLSHRSLAEIACMLLGLVAVVQHFSIAGEKRHSAKVEAHDRASTQALDRSVRGRLADRAAYAAAQAQAKQLNDATLVRVKTQQERISSDVQSDYRRELGDLRRQLRNGPQGPAAVAGGPGHDRAPEVPGAAGRPGQASGLPLPPGDFLRAAEIELQLDKLIDWVEQQSTVDPNAPK